MKLIKVGATWCGKCKILEKQLPKVQEKYEVVSLDAENNFEEVSKLPKIKTLPIMFIMDNDNNVLNTLVGLHKADDIIQRIEELNS